MSRVRRLLLGYLFPALLLHGEFGDGWMSGGWGVRPSNCPDDDVGSRARSPGAQCACLPIPVGARSPFAPAAPTVGFAAAVFFLEGCEPRPYIFYLSHP